MARIILTYCYYTDNDVQRTWIFEGDVKPKDALARIRNQFPDNRIEIRYMTPIEDSPSILGTPNIT